VDAYIGVLALQGDFAEHIQMLGALGVSACEVRHSKHLDGINGLIIPGGESTTIGMLVDRYEMGDPIRDLAMEGTPIWGTCAGLILMAHDAGRQQPLLDLLDITVERNAFGRQLESFEVSLDVEGLAEGSFPAVFIRAPRVRSVGEGVDVLARLDDGSVVAVQQKHLLGTAFHPELTQDLRMHAYFVGMTEAA
jgi:5'-phosphate synthase pdxT subunit